MNDYDRLMADLGANSELFHDAVQSVIENSQADPETKQLVTDVCEKIEIAIKIISIQIKDTLELQSK